MSRPHDWTALGHGCDPIPGCPDTVVVNGRAYHQTAETIRTAVDTLRNLDDQVVTQSLAVDAVLAKSKDLACTMEKIGCLYEEAGQALMTYAPTLRTSQQTSLRALRMAEPAKEQLDRARRQRNTVIQQWRSSAGGPESDAQFQQQVHQVEAQGIAAKNSLQAAKTMLQQAIVDRDRAADAAADRIDGAVESCPVKDSAWDKIQDILGKVGDAWETFNEIIEPLMPFIDAAILVLSVAALFVPGGAVLTAAVWTARGLSLLSKANTITNIVKDWRKGDFVGVGLGVLSVLPFGKFARIGALHAGKGTISSTLRATGKPKILARWRGHIPHQPFKSYGLPKIARDLTLPQRRLDAALPLLPKATAERLRTTITTGASAVEYAVDYAAGLPKQGYDIYRQSLPDPTRDRAAGLIGATR